MWLLRANNQPHQDVTARAGPITISLCIIRTFLPLAYSPVNNVKVSYGLP